MTLGPLTSHNFDLDSLSRVWPSKDSRLAPSARMASTLRSSATSKNFTQQFDWSPNLPPPKKKIINIINSWELSKQPTVDVVLKASCSCLQVWLHCYTITAAVLLGLHETLDGYSMDRTERCCPQKHSRNLFLGQPWWHDECPVTSRHPFLIGLPTQQAGFPPCPCFGSQQNL